MADLDDNLMDELIAESKEHLEAIEPDLMGLEENPDAVDAEAINRIFRAVHSIKGGFGFFSMNHIKNLAHSMENVMGMIRDGKLTVQPAIVDVLLSGADKLRVLIDDVHFSEDIPVEEEMAQLAKILTAEQEVPPVSRQTDSAPESADSASGSPEYDEAISILNTPGSEALPDNVSDHLADLLHLVYDQVTGEGKSLVEDILADQEACAKAMGLDGILREAIADKLQKVLPYLPISPTPVTTEQVTPESTANKPVNPEKDVADKAQANRKSASAGHKSAGGAQSLRVKVNLLDKLMNLAGELVLSRNRIKQTMDDKLSSAMAASPQLGRFEKQLLASRKRIEDMVSTLVNESGQMPAVAVAKEFEKIDFSLRQLLDTSFSELPGLRGAVQDIDGVTSDLQSGIMGTRMQLVGSVFSKFPRVIRDMNKKLGKDIELSIKGEDVELDKSIIEALGDPLTHLIRNSADHGVEKPEVRKTAGKPTRGKIELAARHEGGQVYIEIIDDGAGIDPEKIKRKAIERNMLTEKDAGDLTEQEILRLIFAPGFSTATQVSDVSGRGVGMDVVRSNIEKIGGTVDIESTFGRGTRITLKLPLTLAIMPVLVIENEERVFAIPQVDIEELVHIRARDAAKRIESIHGKPVMRLREKLLPLVPLNEALGIAGTYMDLSGTRKPDRRNGILDRRASEIAADIPALDEGTINGSSDNRREDDADRRHHRRSAFNVIVLRIGPNRYGLIVETLRDSEEIVVKPLPEYLKKCSAYAGVTIMGDGRIAMILDASGIAKKAQLRFGGDLEEVVSAHSDRYSRESMKEKQLLLLFQNATFERFAINLSMVKRIEKVKQGTIEKVGGKEYLKYKNSSLRLLRLHDFLPIKTPARESEDCYVIVPKFVQHPMGILVSAVEDVLETSASLDRETITGTGIMGSFVIDGALIIFLDVYGLFEAAEPDIYCIGSGEKLRGKRVLLAEDTAFFRTVESTYLRQIGCDVETAVDGEQAWTKLSEGNFDLLVTDIQMPLLDGLGLTARVRASQKYKEMPIVALTSLTNESDRRRILDAGVDAYETKLNKENLRDILASLVSR